MAYAPHKTYHTDWREGTILGSFKNKSHNAFFEFSKNDTGQFPEYPHLVWVGGANVISDQYRFANVKKTVLYIATDEDEYGNLVDEKWQIKNYKAYPKWK